MRGCSILLEHEIITRADQVTTKIDVMTPETKWRWHYPLFILLMTSRRWSLKWSKFMSITPWTITFSGQRHRQTGQRDTGSSCCWFWRPQNIFSSEMIQTMLAARPPRAGTSDKMTLCLFFMTKRIWTVKFLPLPCWRVSEGQACNYSPSGNQPQSCR